MTGTRALDAHERLTIKGRVLNVRDIKKNGKVFNLLIEYQLYEDLCSKTLPITS